MGIQMLKLLQNLFCYPTATIENVELSKKEQEDGKKKELELGAENCETFTSLDYNFSDSTTNDDNHGMNDDPNGNSKNVSRSNSKIQKIFSKSSSKGKNMKRTKYGNIADVNGGFAKNTDCFNSLNNETGINVE
uniref:Uncharacterized protein n=1 Tax=Panagrolaimus sp. ES5 TaxID=591445 RepID=A0AC34GBP1_9BILA